MDLDRGRRDNELVAPVTSPSVPSSPVQIQSIRCYFEGIPIGKDDDDDDDDRSFVEKLGFTSHKQKEIIG